MKKQWTPLTVTALALAVIALVCIGISILFLGGNNIYLQIGLILTCVSNILFQVGNRKK